MTEQQPIPQPMTSDVPLGPPQEPPNLKKAEFLQHLKEEEQRKFSFAVCPQEGHLLRAREYDDAGKPIKFYCPECRKETTDPLIRKYDPHPKGYRWIGPDDKDEPISPQEVANDLKANFLFITDRETGILYRYDDSSHKWAGDGETYLKELLALILANRNRLNLYNNVLHCLNSVTFEEMAFSTRFIACENGLLDVERGILTDFTPNSMPSQSIPVKFDKDAQCPNWLEFLNQVVAPEDVILLQEWSGFLLLPDYRKHKVLWVHGSGFNGKGVWVRTMEGILGKENCSSVPLDQFDGSYRFAMIRLCGRLFNVSSEPTTTRILQTPLLKRVTGQDTIDGEIKGRQQTVSFRNTAKLTVIGNKFPKINDTTLAFQDRMMFVKFSNTFIGKDQIDDLEKVWLDDPQGRSGILNWMLEGLRRLLSQGVFTESKSQKETMLEFQRVSDSISAFLTEQCILGPNGVTARSSAYDCYKEYCDMIGAQPENDKAFTQRLKNTPRIKAGWTRVAGKAERAWEGFSVKPIQDEVATHATVATLLSTPVTISEKSDNYSESTRRVANVASVAETAKDCANFHLSSCSHPNPDCLLPTNSCPGNCRSFKPIAEELPGYDDKCEPPTEEP